MSIKKTTSSLTTRKSVTTTDLSGVVVSAIRVTVPYRWMPKWSPETNDPSARTLQMYAEPQTANQ